MPRVNVRLLLELAPRIIALLLLWSYIPSLLSIASTFTLYLTLSPLIVKPLLTLTVSILAVITIATASPLLYSVTVVLSMVLALYTHSMPSIAISVVGLVALLALDTLKFTYRPKQVVRGLDLKRILASIAAIMVVTAALCILPSSYVATLVNGLVKYLSEAPSIVLRLLGSNPIFVLILSIAITIALYKIVTNIFDIVALFALPSRELALRALTMDKVLKASIEAPLKNLKVLVLASLIAPPLYAVVARVLLPLVVSYVPFLATLLYTKLGTIALIIIMYLLSIAIVRPIVTQLSVNPGRVLALSLTLLALIYVSGVVLSLYVTNDLWFSITHPRLDLVGNEMARVYVGFYTQFFYILEDLMRMIGAAP